MKQSLRCGAVKRNSCVCIAIAYSFNSQEWAVLTIRCFYAITALPAVRVCSVLTMSTSQIVLLTVTENRLRTGARVCTDPAQLPQCRNLDKANRNLVGKEELKKVTLWKAQHG